MARDYKINVYCKYYANQWEITVPIQEGVTRSSRTFVYDILDGLNFIWSVPIAWANKLEFKINLLNYQNNIYGVLYVEYFKVPNSDSIAKLVTRNLWHPYEN